ncbi:MAG: hypothetical protein ABIF71_14605 [Planctomycetota bacterium]
MRINLKTLFYLAGIVGGLLVFALLFKVTLKRSAFLNNYRTGYDAFMAGDFRGAVDKFDRCRAGYPEYTGINSVLAAAYYYDGNLTRAAELFRAVAGPAGTLGQALCRLRETQAQGQLNQTFINSMYQEIRGLSDKDPNVIAAAMAVRVMGSVPADEITPDINIINSYALGQSAIQILPLVAAYNSLGCLHMLATDFDPAGIAFDHARRFAILPADGKIIASNLTATGVAAVSKTPPVNEPAKIDAILKEIGSLSPASQRNAVLNIARAITKVGRPKRALELLETLKPESPEEIVAINALRMNALLTIAQRGERSSPAVLAKLTMYIEELIETAGSAPVTDDTADLRAMFHFITNYYHAGKDTRRLAAATAKALALFPEDPAFLRTMGILKIEQNDFPAGLTLLRESLARNGEQADIAAFLREIFTGLTVTDMQLSTSPPFSVEQPLIRLKLKQGAVPVKPEVREMSMGGLPLRYVVQGDYILATPLQRLPDGFKDFTVKLVATNPATGQTGTYTATTAQDLIPPEIAITVPARGGAMKLSEARVEMEITDGQSEIDFSSLDIVIISGGAGTDTRAYRFYAVKSGIYQAVKDIPRNTPVSNGHIKFQPNIPVPGVYSITITVYDKAKNRQVLADWQFTLTP